MKKYLPQCIYRQEGVALYLSIAIMGLVLALAVGVSTTLLREIRIARDIARYTPALAAADAGIERALYEIRENANFSSCPTISACTIGSKASPIELDAASEYYVIILDTGVEWCTEAEQTCIRSFGSYLNTNRALEASF